MFIHAIKVRRVKKVERDREEVGKVVIRPADESCSRTGQETCKLSQHVDGMTKLEKHSRRLDARAHHYYGFLLTFIFVSQWIKFSDCSLLYKALTLCGLRVSIHDRG